MSEYRVMVWRCSGGVKGRPDSAWRSVGAYRSALLLTSTWPFNLYLERACFTVCGSADGAFPGLGLGLRCHLYQRPHYMVRDAVHNRLVTRAGENGGRCVYHLLDYIFLFAQCNVGFLHRHLLEGYGVAGRCLGQPRYVRGDDGGYLGVAAGGAPVR